MLDYAAEDRYLELAGGSDEPRLYRELAPWFHLLTSPADYAEEAELYGRVLVEHADGPVETVLELGSGGGNNASHLKRHFALTLVDRSPEMLELSRGLNPEFEHVEGDMRTRPARPCLRRRLRARRARVHPHRAGTAGRLRDRIRSLPAGRSAVFVPDYVRETFEPRTSHGGHDSEDGQRGLRYVEWVRLDPSDQMRHVVDFAYLIREGETSASSRTVTSAGCSLKKRGSPSREAGST